MIQEYRAKFNQFVQHQTIGPFAEKKQLSGDDVNAELESFQATRDKYVAFDQGADDQNKELGQVKVATETAFPPPELSAENKRTKALFEEALSGMDMIADTSNDFLNIKIDDQNIEVEETGTRQGVYFTKTDGNDTYYMSVGFSGETDVVEAVHLNSASGTGTIEKLQVVLPPENEPKEPEGTTILSLGGGGKVLEDADGILRLGM
jgi:hypothetical protein